MRNIATLFFLGACAPAMLLAQNSGSGTAPQAGTVSIQQLGKAKAAEKTNSNAPTSVANERVQPGSIMYAELDKSLDAKKAKTGDAVVAKLQQPLLSKGQIIAPRGAKVIGHITQVQARSKEHPQSQLGVVFDHIVLKDGTQLPASLTLQAIGAGTTAAALTNNSDASMSSPIAPAGMPGRNSNPGMLGSAGAPIADPSGTVGDVADPAGGVGPVRANTSTHVSASSHGVLGMSNIEMAEGSAAQGSVITSDKKNVKLESGSELVLRAQ